MRVRRRHPARLEIILNRDRKPLDGSPFSDHLFPSAFAIGYGLTVSLATPQAFFGIVGLLIVVVPLFPAERRRSLKLSREDADASLLAGIRGFRVRESIEARPRLFLTFAGVDLALARPAAAQLRSVGGLTLDWAVTSEPFAAQRSDLIRASLAQRLRRCAATVCLFGAETLEDDWVRWTLAAARHLRQPLLGAPFSIAESGDVAGLLASIGAEIVPLRGEAIVQRLAHRPAPSRTEPLTVDALADALRLMKHPLR